MTVGTVAALFGRRSTAVLLTIGIETSARTHASHSKHLVLATLGWTVGGAAPIERPVADIVALGVDQTPVDHFGVGDAAHAVLFGSVALVYADVKQAAIE